MKILYLVTSADLAGAPRNVLDLVNGLRGKHQIQVVAGEDGPLLQLLKQLQIPTQIIPIAKHISLFRDLRSTWNVFWFIRRQRFDIVHCHSSKAGIIGRIAAFMAKTSKVIYTAHGFVFTDPGLSRVHRVTYALIERMMAMITTHLIVVSEYDRMQAIKLKIHAQKTHLVHNGVRDEFVLSIEEWRKMNEAKVTHTLIIGIIGRLVKEKNMRMFIHVAASLLRRTKLELKFWIIGDGPLKQKLEQQVMHEGLEHKITFMGEQSNVMDWMDQMSILVISSRKEGLPYVLLEGMGRGLPIVSTDVGGIREALHPEEDWNVVVPLDDIDAMSETILKLIHEPKFRDKLSLHALTRVQNYRVNEMCNKVDEIYCC